MTTPNQRGARFEDRVEVILNGLRSEFPALVAFDHPFTLMLRTGRDVKPDFRLAVRMPHQTDVRLIECQSRDATDHALADKINTIRKDSDHKRFIFVYENRPSDAVMTEFEQQGVVVYAADEFERFITDLTTTLRAVAPVIMVPPTGVPPAAASTPPTAPPPSHHRIEKTFSPGSVTTRVFNPHPSGGGPQRGGFGGNFRAK